MDVWRKNSDIGISKFEASEVREYNYVQASSNKAHVSRGKAESGRVTADGDKKGTGAQPCKGLSRPFIRTLAFTQS